MVKSTLRLQTYFFRNFQCFCVCFLEIIQALTYVFFDKLHKLLCLFFHTKRYISLIHKLYHNLINRLDQIRSLYLQDQIRSLYPVTNLILSILDYIIYIIYFIYLILSYLQEILSYFILYKMPMLRIEPRTPK